MGFLSWRREEGEDDFETISVEIPGEEGPVDSVPGKGDIVGASYDAYDVNVTPGIDYEYKLQDVPDDGSEGEFFGPVTPVVNDTSSPTPTSTPKPAATDTPTPTDDPASTSTPTPQPTATSPAPTPTPYVMFQADQEDLSAGTCTTLRWRVEYVYEAYLDGQLVPSSDTMTVCPCEDETHTLRVIYKDDTEEDFNIALSVTGTCEDASDATATATPFRVTTATPGATATPFASPTATGTPDTDTPTLTPSSTPSSIAETDSPIATPTAPATSRALAEGDAATPAPSPSDSPTRPPVEGETTTSSARTQTPHQSVPARWWCWNWPVAHRRGHMAMELSTEPASVRCHRYSILLAVGLLLAGFILAGCGARPTPSPAIPATPPSQWTLAVRADGPRWLGADWWRAQGLDPATLSHENVRLQQAGRDIPTRWIDAPDGPGLLFYGQTTTDLEDLGPAGAYTLTLGAPGTPMASAPSLPLHAPFQLTTTATLRRAPDLVYRSTAPTTRPWFWRSLFAPDALTLTLPLTDAVPGPVALSLRVWGQSRAPQAPDHHLRVLWDGVEVSDHFWDGSEMEAWTVEGADLTTDGSESHTLVLDAPGDTGAPVDVTWIDAITVTWTRNLRFDGDNADWARWRATAASAACWEDLSDDAHLLMVPSKSEGEVWHAKVGDIATTEAGRRCLPQELFGQGWIGRPEAAPPRISSVRARRSPCPRCWRPPT